MRAKQLRIALIVVLIVCTALPTIFWMNPPAESSRASRAEAQNFINFQWTHVKNGEGVGLTVLRSATAYSYSVAEVERAQL